MAEEGIAAGECIPGSGVDLPDSGCNAGQDFRFAVGHRLSE
jgi:hypothetical protein